MAKKSAFGGLLGGLRAFWQYTTNYYVPNKQEFQADGGRYGALYSSILRLENSQEFSIAVNAVAREVGSSAYIINLRPDPMQDPRPVTDPKDPFLNLLKHPNPLHTWQSWIETIVMLLLPAGNAYILKDPVSVFGNPLALWILRPDRCRPIRQDDPLHPVQSYEYYSEDGHRYVFPADRVIHIKLPNPYTDYQGLGNARLLEMSLEMDYRSMESNLNLFRQGGRLNTVLETKGEIDPDKAKELIRKIKEAHMGSENAHKVLLLEAGLELNAAASGQRPAEADYTNTRADISRGIGGMLGVPPMIMGQLANVNRATATVQQQLFLRNAVWPLMRRLTPMLQLIADTYQRNYEFSFPMADVLDPEIMSTLIENAGKSGAASPNDIREWYLQRPRSKNPAMEKHYLFGVQGSIEDGAAQMATPPANTPEAKPAGGPGAPALPPKAVAKPPVPDRPTPIGPLTPLASLTNSATRALADKDGRPFPKGTQAQRRYLRAIDAARPEIEKAIAPVFEKHFKAVGAQMATQLEARGKNARPVSREGIRAFADGIKRAYDNTGTAAGLVQQTGPVYEAQLVAAAQTAASIFKVTMEDFTPNSASFANAAQSLGLRIKGVDQAVQDQIAKIIEDGAAQGLSPYQIANGNSDGSFPGLKNEIEGIAEERAMLIARTESVHLQDLANTEAFKRMGVRTCDVIGCEDFVIMPGETYGCNSQGVPTASLPISFHPNHRGAVVPHVDEA